MRYYYAVVVTEMACDALNVHGQAHTMQEAIPQIISGIEFFSSFQEASGLIRRHKGPRNTRSAAAEPEFWYFAVIFENYLDISYTLYLFLFRIGRFVP